MRTLNRIAMWVIVITLIAGTIMWYSFRDSEFDPRTFNSFENAVESTVEGVIDSAGSMDYEIYAEKEVSVPEKTLVMDVVSSDIEVKFHNENVVKAIMHGKASTDNEDKLPKLIVNESGSKVEVIVKWPNMNVGFISTDINLDVYIPEHYKEEMHFDAVSGDVSLSGGKFDRVSAETVSGDVNFDDFEARNIDIKTTSGEASVRNVQAVTFDLDTTSGDYEFEGVSGKIEFGSVSGKMEFDLLEWKGDVQGDTVSGDVRINGPQASVDVDFESISGDVDSNFSFDTISKKDDDILKASNNGSDYYLKVDTVSGDIKLMK